MEPNENAPNPAGLFATKLCGSDYYQVVPGGQVFADFDALAERLGIIGEVTRGPFTLSFSDDKYEIIVFQDGRAMIKRVPDANNAKSVYAEYIGL